MQTNSPEAEKALVGLCIDSGVILPQVLAEVPTEAIYDANNRIIYESLEQMQSQGTSIDIVTLVDYLRGIGKLGTVGGATYIAELATKGIPGHAPSYIKLVLQAYYDKRIVGMVEELRLRLDLPLVEKMRRLCYLRESLGENHWCDIGRDIHGLLNDLEKEQKMPRLQTGYTELDKILIGLAWEDVFTVAGRPGVGKTAFLVKIALKFAGEKYPVFFFSTQLGKIQIIQRILPLISDIEAWRFRARKLNPDNWVEITRKSEEILTKIPLKISDIASPTIENIRNSVKNAKPKVLIIDYLQRCTMGRADNYARAVSEFMKNLKTLTKEQSVLTFLGCQIKRETDYSKRKRPMMADLKESGGIEEESTQVLMLWNPDTKNRNKIEGLVRKNTHGPLGQVDFHMNPSNIEIAEGEIGPREEEATPREDIQDDTDFLF